MPEASSFDWQTFREALGQLVTQLERRSFTNADAVWAGSSLQLAQELLTRLSRIAGG
jgi:hypothetical protein